MKGSDEKQVAAAGLGVMGAIRESVQKGDIVC